MRIFLTGASGYLGSLLIERLDSLPEVEGITGIALSRPSRKVPPKAKFLKLDMRSPELAKAMAGHDAVVHTACVVLWSASMPVRERDDINLNGVCNVARAALANKVPRFIHTSSLAAYDPEKVRGQSLVAEDGPLGTGASRFYYWNAKAAAEKSLAEILGPTDTLLTSFRPIYIIGPRNRSIVKNYRKNAVNLLGHDPRRQFIHEDDVVDAFVRALHQDMPGPYNVVPDDFMRLSEVWKAVGARFVPTVPLWLARSVAGFRWRFLGSPIHPCWVEDMLVDLTGDNRRLKETGWRPRFSSAEALRSAL